MVSENYFGVFGVKPAIGRLFMQGDAAAAGQDPYAVISYDYWRRRFGRNPSVLGATIRIHSAALVIIGVAAPGFRGETVGQDPDLWLPITHAAARNARWGRHCTISWTAHKTS